jgi:hypothetical protein
VKEMGILSIENWLQQERKQEQKREEVTTY